MGLFSSKMERFWPLVPPKGAVCTENTWPFPGLWRGDTKPLLGLPLFLIRVCLSRFIKLLGNQGGACASSKQQQATSPAGPFLAPRATGVPKSKKNATTLSGMVFRNFRAILFLVGPPPVRNGDLVVFWPILGLAHLAKLQARAENIKPQCPGARAPE